MASPLPCRLCHLVFMAFVGVSAGESAEKFSSKVLQAAALRRSGRDSSAHTQLSVSGSVSGQSNPATLPLDLATSKKHGSSGYMVRTAGAQGMPFDQDAKNNVETYQDSKSADMYYPPYPVDQTIPRVPDANGNIWDEPNWRDNAPAPAPTR
mmetsp:Transcript_11917/g.26527  ORF Transcript_11917/g.26527 Transcript_11917/m.26527 type:complete len:152 (-) Transcript_11917:66-521(-)